MRKEIQLTKKFVYEDVSNHETILEISINDNSKFFSFTKFDKVYKDWSEVCFEFNGSSFIQIPKELIEVFQILKDISEIDDPGCRLSLFYSFFKFSQNHCPEAVLTFLFTLSRFLNVTNAELLFDELNSLTLSFPSHKNYKDGYFTLSNEFCPSFHADLRNRKFPITVFWGEERYDISVKKHSRRFSLSFKESGYKGPVVFYKDTEEAKERARFFKRMDLIFWLPIKIAEGLENIVRKALHRLHSKIFGSKNP